MKEKKPYKRNFMTDIWRKIVSLLLAAITMALLFHLLPTFKKKVRLTIPISALQYDKNQYSLIEPLPTIEFNALSITKENLSSQDFEITGINLTKSLPTESKGPFTHTVKLSKKNIRCKKWTTFVNEESLPNIELSFDIIISNTVEVRWQTQGTPHAGYQPSVELIQPDEISDLLQPNAQLTQRKNLKMNIYGPSLLIKDIKFLYTTPIQLQDECKTPFTCTVEIPPIVRNGKKIKVEYQELKAKVNFRRIGSDISSNSQDHQLHTPILVQTSFPCIWGIRNISKPDVNVIIHGKLSPKELGNIRAYVDIHAETKPGHVKKKVLLMNCPPGVEADIVPQEITVELFFITTPTEKQPGFHQVAPATISSASSGLQVAQPKKTNSKQEPTPKK